MDHRSSTARVDAEDAEAKLAWHERLPGPIQSVLHFVYFDLLEPDDSFEVAMRKMLLAVGPFMFWFGPAVVVALFLITGTLATTGGFVGLAIMALFGLLWYGTFVVGKRDHAAAGAGTLTDVWLVGSMVLLGCVATVVPLMPWNIAALQIFLFGMACRATRKGLLLVAGTTVYVLACVNRESFGRGDEPEFTAPIVPRFFDGRSLLFRYLYEFVMFSAFVPVLAALEMHFRESERRQAASRDSVMLARSLAAALSRYDTRGAATAIAEARAAGTHADGELLAGFESIVANLDDYRPHLPNWLINKRAHRSSGDDEGNVDEDHGDLASELSRLPSRVRCDAALDSASNTSRSSRASRRSKSTDGRHSLGRRNTGSMPLAAGRNALFKGPVAVIRTVRAACAELEFRRPAGVTDAGALHAFVDRVHAVALETRAAVHGFIGDTVLATWNVAGACAQPDVRAARFAARLLHGSHPHQRASASNNGSFATDAAAAESPLPVTGAIAYGAAAVLMAGLGDQRALTADFGEGVRELQRAARRRAREAGQVLLTAAAAKNVEFAVHVELAAALPWTPSDADDKQAPKLAATAQSPPSSPLSPDGTKAVQLLYGLRHEHAEGTDDEWMYVLQQQQGGRGREDAAAFEQALKACAGACREGRFADALHALKDAPTSGAGELDVLTADLQRLAA